MYIVSNLCDWWLFLFGRLNVLTYAVALERKDIVLELLKAGADADFYVVGDDAFQTALSIAVDLQNVEMTELLLEHG